MDITRAQDRFFTTTRGKIVQLLRRGPMTVVELAETLELTDNAVRAHRLVGIAVSFEAAKRALGRIVSEGERIRAAGHWEIPGQHECRGY